MIRTARSLASVLSTFCFLPCAVVFYIVFKNYLPNFFCLITPKRSMMLKKLAASTLYAFRQPASNICLCQSLKFKKIKLEIDNDMPTKNKYRPKTVPQPKITLLGPDKDISVVTMDVASKMCERRGLKLVKIIDIDTKTQRPVYKMMTSNQFLKEDKIHQIKDEKKLNKLKGEKTALISCRIGQGDLDSKINNFRKWLIKMHEVRITVTGDTANEIADEIIKMTQDCSRVVQRREKGDFVKFQLLPPKKT